MKYLSMILLFANQAFAADLSSYVPKQAVNTATGPTQNSIYDSATQTKKQNEAAQKQAQMISAALRSSGEQLISACCGDTGCSSQCPTGIGLVVMAGMAAMQASSHGSTANRAGMTMGATDAFDDGYNNGRTVGSDGSGFSKIGEETAKKFAAKGITFDGSKFTAPNGTKIGVDDMASASSMAAAGISKGGIASISAEVTKANKAATDKIKLTTPNFGFSEGGGGGGAFDKAAATSSAGGLAGGSGYIDMSSMNTKGAAAGLTINYKGDPIGIANDSIFGMMTRRYQLKEHQESFFDSKTAAQK